MKIKWTIRLDIMLFIIFLIWKLNGTIQWNWAWIFSPIWVNWIIQACIFFVAKIKAFEWKCSIARPVVSGPRLVWDAKTKTLYGPNMNGDDNDC